MLVFQLPIRFGIAQYHVMAYPFFGEGMLLEDPNCRWCYLIVLTTHSLWDCTARSPGMVIYRVRFPMVYLLCDYTIIIVVLPSGHLFK